MGGPIALASPVVADALDLQLAESRGHPFCTMLLAKHAAELGETVREVTRSVGEVTRSVVEIALPTVRVPQAWNLR
jgi:hypothetical protein